MITIWNWIKDWYIEYLGTPFKELFFKVFPAKHQRAYLRSLLRHKYYVFLAGMKLGVSIWLLVIHDWSKFLPDEFNPYSDTFHNPELAEWEKINAEAKFGPEYQLYAPFGWFTKDRFNMAWLHHQRRNPHHWQYWYMLDNERPYLVLPMPEAFAREMVADWYAVGKDYPGALPLKEYYEKNKAVFILHPDTRLLVESLIAKFSME